MPNVDEFILVTDNNLGLVNEEMVVIATSDKLSDIHHTFKGKNAIIAEDKHGGRYVLDPSQYREKFKSTKEFKRIAFDNIIEDDGSSIRLHDTVTLNHRDKGTKRLFYTVVELHKNGVSFIDDFGEKRTYPFKDVKKIDYNFPTDYLFDLQEQIHELRQLVVSILELIDDDIQRKLQEFQG